MTDVFSYNLEKLHQAAEFVINRAKEYKIWCFYGQMGSGKTTLIKKICEIFQVTNTVNSPTFSIVNEYKTSDNQVIYHFDFYRIKHIEEVFDIGYEDYFYSNNLCLIEWPELIDPIIPQNISCSIKISVQNTHRELTVEPNL